VSEVWLFISVLTIVYAGLQNFTQWTTHHGFIRKSLQHGERCTTTAHWNVAENTARIFNGGKQLPSSATLYFVDESSKHSRGRHHTYRKCIPDTQATTPVQELSVEGRVCILASISNHDTDNVCRYIKPWIDDKRLKRTKIGNWIVLGFIAVGVVLSGYIMFTGAQEAQTPAVRRSWVTLTTEY
jgi:hypothetical protein